MKKQSVHMIRVGAMKTPSGYVQTFCGLIDGVMNKVSTQKHDVTCKKCVSQISQYEFKVKKEMQAHGKKIH